MTITDSNGDCAIWGVTRTMFGATSYVRRNSNSTAYLVYNTKVDATSSHPYCRALTLTWFIPTEIYQPLIVVLVVAVPRSRRGVNEPCS